MKRSRLTACIKLAAVLGCSALVAACSTDFAMFKADSSWWSTSKVTTNEPLSRPVPPDQLIAAGGVCPPAAADALHGVGVGMTECEAFNALGPTDLIDIGTNEQGQRAVVLTYTKGERAGVYRFASGQLISIEALPTPPKPERPARRQRQR